jgi:amidase
VLEGSASPDKPFWSARQLAQAIRDKKIGCLELLNAYLARVERYNKNVNAIVQFDIPGAQMRAATADDALARGERLGPLHGVPITINESIDVAGFASTWGVSDLKDHRPAGNAVVVDALMQAGAIVFGKTNVSRYGLGWQTFNDLYGTTNNPWDLSRSPGGSSGGPAAALAAGLTGLDVGGDTDGSLRNPAHYCGIYAHKPTFGVISLEGQSLPGLGPAPDIAVAGPMARSAEDLALAFRLMAKPSAADAIAWRLMLPPPRKTKLSDFKIAVMLKDETCDVDREVQTRLQALADFLSSQGAEVSMQARPKIDTAVTRRLFLKLAYAATSGSTLESTWKQASWRALFLRERNQSDFACMVRGLTLRHRDWIRLDAARSHLRTAWSEFFREHDLMLCPAAASAAISHDHSGRWDGDRTIEVNGRRTVSTDQTFWAGLASVAYLPATVAPAGSTATGLPVGVQIIGPQYGDNTCLTFARLLEEEFQPFVPPKGWD